MIHATYKGYTTGLGFLTWVKRGHRKVHGNLSTQGKKYVNHLEKRRDAIVICSVNVLDRVFAHMKVVCMYDWTLDAHALKCTWGYIRTCINRN